MPLPTLADTKSYLRIETGAEDGLVTDLLAQATGWAEQLIGRPITAVARTFTIYQPMRGAMFLPVWPVASSPAVAITDADGATVAATSYTVDRTTGFVRGLNGTVFTKGPYTVTATVGLSAHPDYLTRYEARLRALILGLVAVLYHQRNPNASSQSEAGASVSYRDDELPPHLRSIASALRPVRV